MRILDEYGKEMSWEKFVEQFGPIVVHPAGPGLGWRLKTIYVNRDLRPSRIGPQAAATIMVRALGADGLPAVGLWIAWYWPDAPENPQAMPPNGLPPGMKTNRADRPGETNLNGDVGFAMGRGAYYSPPKIGPHAVWVWAQNTDVVFGLGMLKGSDHDHVDLEFELTTGGSPEPPIPQPFPIEEFLAQLLVIQQACEEMSRLLPPVPPDVAVD